MKERVSRNVLEMHENCTIKYQISKSKLTRCESFQNLAILVFNQEYRNTSRFEELPGVEKDRVELTELLSEYQQILIKNADNVLHELQSIIDEKKDEKFERVHFHFSGNYKWDGQD